MQVNKDIQSGTEAPGVIVAGADIPQHVFSRRFGNYLFFDADIGSSGALILAIQLIVRTCFGVESKVKVFTSSNRELLGCLSSDDAWPVEVSKISKAMRNSGDCSGLVLVDATGKWAVYQNRPIDVGVFAFDGGQDLRSIATVIEDCFFSIVNKLRTGYLQKGSAISAWLKVLVVISLMP